MPKKKENVNSMHCQQQAYCQNCGIISRGQIFAIFVPLRGKCVKAATSAICWALVAMRALLSSSVTLKKIWLNFLHNRTNRNNRTILLAYQITSVVADEKGIANKALSIAKKI